MKFRQPHPWKSSLSEMENLQLRDVTKRPDFLLLQKNSLKFLQIAQEQNPLWAPEVAPIL